MEGNKVKYGYSVRTDFGFPILIRYHNGEVETFRPDGWERTPGKDSILNGGGDFVWYDDISEEEAVNYMKQIREFDADKLATV